MHILIKKYHWRKYMQKSKFLLTIISIVTLCSVTLPCYSFLNNYTWSVYDNTLETSTSLNESSNVLDNNSLALEAGSAILIEQNSGQILYGYNVHENVLRFTILFSSAMGGSTRFSTVNSEGIFDLSNPLIQCKNFVLTFDETSGLN